MTINWKIILRGTFLLLAFCVDSLLSQGCGAIACKAGQLCETNSEGTGQCICESVCTADYTPVCATDGTTHSNLCLLNLHACQTNRNITKAHDGECTAGCDAIVCGTGQSCETNSKGMGQCVCNTVCTEDYSPVCGSDGTTYSNTCWLSVQACQSNIEITKTHDGECNNTGSTTATSSTPISTEKNSTDVTSSSTDDQITTSSDDQITTSSDVQITTSSDGDVQGRDEIRTDRNQLIPWVVPVVVVAVCLVLTSIIVAIVMLLRRKMKSHVKSSDIETDQKESVYANEDQINNLNRNADNVTEVENPLRTEYQNFESPADDYCNLGGMATEGVQIDNKYEQLDDGRNYEPLAVYQQLQ